MKKHWTTGLLAAGMVLAASSMASAQTLRIGLQEDPDLLDPDLARSFVGRIVFTSLCDKLIDIDENLDFVPELATEWSWSDDNTVLTMKLREGVVFHDGEPFNAEAVKYNIERSLNLPGSNRRSEIAAVSGVEVVDEHTVQLNLSQPFSPLLAALADRAGMMISPAAAEAAGEDFALAPVCSGPFKFVDRVAQDRIVLEKFDDHWNADAYQIEEVIYQPIPDTTVRLANLQSGDLDLIERTAPSDLPTLRNTPGLRLEQATSLGYQGITINVGNGPRADNPLGTDPRVREALELALDRNIINQAGFDGEYTIGNQPVAPSNAYYIDSIAISERNVEQARQILTEAGYDRVAFELMVPNSTDQMRVAQVVQALAGEAGFDVSISSTEFATALDRQTNGDFEAFLIGWSGRADPDGNIHVFIACNGALNDGKYCNETVDQHLNAARATADFETRYAEYEKAAQIYLEERPRIYLYHPNWFWGVSDRVQGFKPYPDGMIRLEGVTLSE